ncbi:MAG: hypothetical protein FWD31_09890, partial [Planctomycetaceae bacterium]|nr:hypothetical protein [Planctomycetaceae bacterium]
DRLITVTVEADGFDAVSTVITVLDVPPAELVIDSVEVSPTSTWPNLDIDVTWTITNLGELPPQDGLVTRIYISADAQIENATLLKTLDPTTIDAGDSLPFSEIVTIPTGALGECWIIIETTYDGLTVSAISNAITVLTPSLGIAVDKDSLKEGIEDGVEFVITRTGDLSEDLVLTITTSDAAALTVPETVTIPAGESTVTFYGSSILYEIRDGDRQATVTVSAEGFDDVTTVITVLDLLPAELVVELLVMPEQVVAGTQINVSWVIRNIGELPFEDSIIELLYINDTGYIDDCVSLGSFSQIRLIEGLGQLERTETFTIPLDYSGEYRIVLAIPGKASFLVGNVFTVVAPEIIVTSDVSEIAEGIGVTFTVTRTGDLSEDLVLTITSSDASKLTVPEFVTIPAGESEITFCGTSVTTNVRGDDVSVTVTIAAANFETQSLEVLVLDDTQIELVNTELTAPMVARHDTTIDVSWRTTSSATFISQPDEWVDNIYLSPDGSMENAVLVGSFVVDAQIDAGESLDWTRSVTIPEGLSGDFVLILETMFGETQSELVFADIHLFIDTYTLRLTMPDQENGHWTLRQDDDKLWIVNDLEQTIYVEELDLLDGVVILGHSEQCNTLTLLGTDGDDVFYFNGSQGTVNGLSVAWSDVAYVCIDGKAGFDTVTIISDESASARFTVSDHLFVMDNGGVHVEIVNVDSIDAFGAGKHNSATIYGENDSLMIMNDLFVERRSEAGMFRVWNCEQVTAVNADDSNNAMVHTGSRGYDLFTMSEGYGTVTNAIGSYYHELIGFANVNIATPWTMPAVSLPDEAEWLQEDALAVWTQNEFAVTVFGNAQIATRTIADLPGTPGEEPDEPSPDTKHKKSSKRHDDRFDNKHFGDDHSDHDFSHNFGHKHWDESLCAFLAEEHVRSHRKKDKWFGQDDEGDDWLAEFDERALLELMKQ